MMFDIENLIIKRMNYKDCERISKAFELQGLYKPIELYEDYLVNQNNKLRVVLVAEYDGQFIGYITILWRSHYKYFLENNIPELTDLNVLIKYRRKGVATKLLKEAEAIVAEQYNEVGIGVGLLKDFGPAQRLYAKTGYIPDGLGASKVGHHLEYGHKIITDDDLILCFTKQLNRRVHVYKNELAV